MSTEDQNELLQDDAMDNLADAEVLMTELLRDSQQGPLKKAVNSVITTAEDSMGELRNLYERKPYYGLLLAGCIGLAVGLIVTHKSED